ncbi:MAG: hypothetical protein HY077_00305 [Elusimicrobia bacterium]|nr:hypothetical protein [Elusimicrobiota bacterium]
MAPLALLLALASPAAAVSVSTEPFIAGVRVEHVNVFDPAVQGENWWLFRLADRIHFTTREEVIRRELLLGPGDKWDSFKALESERNLRQLNIFRRAEVKPVPKPDGKLDLLARTQDSWTLALQAGAGTEGGQTLLRYGVSEDNLLGYGKSIGAFHTEDGRLVRNEFRYRDSRFLGSRFSFDPFFTRTGHGTSVGSDLIRPFFSLETPTAAGGNWSHTVDESILYRDSEEGSKFVLKNDTVLAATGARLPQDRWAAQRVEAGWYAQKDQFYPFDLTADGTLPTDRTLSGPVVGYNLVQPRYVKETYINKMERVEDFNMGNELRVFGGFMGRALGSDRDRWIYNIADQQGVYFAPGRFILAQIGAKGRLANARPDNTLIFANLNLFYATDWQIPQTWVAHIEANKGRNLDGENQIILGGNNGLRGYKNYSFTGAESLLLNLEDRFFLPGEYFHLVRFGAAVFWDTGAVEPAGRGMTFKDFRSDLGLGLRASPTRGQTGNVVRLDLARSLQRGPGPDRWVVSLTGSQAFQIFNSSTKSVRGSPSSQLVVEPRR